MCGIVAYIGNKEAFPILVKGLHRLEYRGYDSSGVAVLNGSLRQYKCKGKVADLEAFVEGKDVSGNIGIAHTRWATHGEPNDINAHPHFSQSKSISIIHNGIIENYKVLKEELINRGYHFVSETDTEVVAHLIEDIFKNEDVDLVEAVRIALNQVIGAYAIVVISKEDPDLLIAAKKGSPMVIGIGEDEFIVASDATPIIEYTRKVVYLDDEDMAILRRGKDIQMKTISNVEHSAYVQELTMNLNVLEKEGYDHFMLKEIHEQPVSVRESMRGRLQASKGIVRLGGVSEYHAKLKNAKRIIMIACGTS